MCNMPCGWCVQGKQVSRSSLLQNLVRNTNINLAGIGITLIGLQASGAVLFGIRGRCTDMCTRLLGKTSARECVWGGGG